MLRKQALELIGLDVLMARTTGRPDVTVGVLDGPVATDHPELVGSRMHAAPGGAGTACRDPRSAACRHGTFVAGILAARRGGAAPAIFPGCTLLVLPIFAEQPTAAGGLPGATAPELAAAVVACVDAGARILNVGAALDRPAVRPERDLDEALALAARRGVVVVAAAGNQGGVGGWALTRHPWVLPVAACDERGRLLPSSTLSRSLGRRGLRAPGDEITSLGPDGAPVAAVPSKGASTMAVPGFSGEAGLYRSTTGYRAAATGAQARGAIIPQQLLTIGCTPAFCEPGGTQRCCYPTPTGVQCYTRICPDPCARACGPGGSRARCCICNGGYWDGRYCE